MLPVGRETKSVVAIRQGDYECCCQWAGRLRVLLPVAGRLRVLLPVGRETKSVVAGRQGD